MAIESKYWREELLRIHKLLTPSRQPRRWSERHLCTVERDVMIGFFIVRRLVELRKVGASARNLKLSVHRNFPNKNITLMNRYGIDENYNWDREVGEKVSITFVANQFIHATLSVLVRDKSRNWSNFYVFSDYEQKKSVMRIHISEIRTCFKTVANSWPRTLKMRYNQTKMDYEYYD